MINKILILPMKFLSTQDSLLKVAHQNQVRHILKEIFSTIIFSFQHYISRILQAMDKYTNMVAEPRPSAFPLKHNSFMIRL